MANRQNVDEETTITWIASEMISVASFSNKMFISMTLW